MTLKLQLVKDKEVIFEVPISPSQWTKTKLEEELTTNDEEIRRLTKIFEAFAHETRLKMMNLLLMDEDCTVSFADFMRDLDLNPKLVWENARKLSEEGLLKKVGRGRYCISDFGQKVFIMMNLALKHLIETLDEIDEF